MSAGTVSRAIALLVLLVCPVYIATCAYRRSIETGVISAIEAAIQNKVERGPLEIRDLVPPKYRGTFKNERETIIDVDSSIGRYAYIEYNTHEGSVRIWAIGDEVIMAHVIHSIDRRTSQFYIVDHERATLFDSVRAIDTEF